MEAITENRWLVVPPMQRFCFILQVGLRCKGCRSQSKVLSEAAMDTLRGVEEGGQQCLIRPAPGVSFIPCHWDGCTKRLASPTLLFKVSFGLHTHTKQDQTPRILAAPLH